MGPCNALRETGKEPSYLGMGLFTCKTIFHLLHYIWFGSTIHVIIVFLHLFRVLDFFGKFLHKFSSVTRNLPLQSWGLGIEVKMTTYKYLIKNLALKLISSPPPIKNIIFGKKFPSCWI